MCVVGGGGVAGRMKQGRGCRVTCNPPESTSSGTHSSCTSLSCHLRPSHSLVVLLLCVLSIMLFFFACNPQAAQEGARLPQKPGWPLLALRLRPAAGDDRRHCRAAAGAEQHAARQVDGGAAAAVLRAAVVAAGCCSISSSTGG